MPITDYAFEDRIFFAKEMGEISKEDAQEWADRLRDAAATSDLPIVALIDAIEVASVHRAAAKIFMECANTDNLLASVVATNRTITVQANMIRSSVKRGHTIIMSSLEQARKRAEEIVQEDVMTFE